MAGRPRSFDEEQVLDRAMEIFWRDGYASASMQVLLAHMGISRQSLYNTFGCKRRLFLRALDRYISLKAEPMLAPLEAEDAGFAAIEDLFARLEQGARSGCAQTKRPCLIGKTCMELVCDDTDVAGRVEAHFQRITGAFEHALDNAVRQGEIAPCDVRAVARHLTATLNGLGLMLQAGACADTLASAAAVALGVVQRPSHDVCA
ncbi:MAG: TetR/AcrR family transcriptional regulator [Myxococcota bacterium]